MKMTIEYGRMLALLPTWMLLGLHLFYQAIVFVDQMLKRTAIQLLYKMSITVQV